MKHTFVGKNELPQICWIIYNIFIQYLSILTSVVITSINQFLAVQWLVGMARMELISLQYSTHGCLGYF